MLYWSLLVYREQNKEKKLQNGMVRTKKKLLFPHMFLLD